MTDALLTLYRHASRRTRGVLDYADLYRQRRALAKLDDHLLRDIGLSAQDAAREVREPIWAAPSHWKC